MSPEYSCPRNIPEQGYGVDIYSRRREFLTQEAPCSGARIYLTDLIDPLDTAILFAPGIQISEETISDVEKTFRQYDLVIGIDLGIIEACQVAKIIRIPYGLISYELIFEEEVGQELKEPEIIACGDLSFTVGSARHALRLRTGFLQIKS